MIRRFTLLATLLFTSSVLSAGTANAHGLGPDRLVVRVAGDTVHLVATPSVRTIPFVDRDRDGNVTLAELRPFEHAILRRFGPQFLSIIPLTQDGERQDVSAERDFFQNVRLPHRHGMTPVDYVRVERRFKLSAEVLSSARVEWTGAHRTAPTRVTMLKTSAGDTTREQRPLSPPQTAEFLRTSSSHVFDFARRKSVAPEEHADAPHPAVPGLPPALRHFGFLLSGLLMALGIARWIKP